MARLGVECDFPMFLSLQMMLFPMPSKLQNGLSFFSFLYNFGRFTRPQTPHFSALDPKNSTSAPLFRCPEPRFLIPQNTFWDIPFCLLGCPILPFGVSHFTIWGIPFHHLGYFKACLCPHIGERFYPLFPLIFPLSGKNSLQTYV